MVSCWAPYSPHALSTENVNGLPTRIFILTKRFNEISEPRAIGVGMTDGVILIVSMA